MTHILGHSQGFTGTSSGFGEFIRWFEQVGGFEIFLPFLLVFTVVFAILQKVPIFGSDENKKPRKNINVIIALIIGLLLVVQGDIVLLINTFIPRVSLLIVIGLMALLLMGLFGGGSEWEGTAFNIAVLLAVLGIIWALLPTGFDIPAIGRLTQQDKAILLTIAIFILVIWFVTYEKKEEKTAIGSFFDSLAKGFKGKKE